MNLTRAFWLLAGVFALSHGAGALTLNPRGTGQVLLFPYFTSNKEQQTLINIVNTTPEGKALKVRFREGYNGRDILDLNVFLAPYDVWTPVVFALADAGLSGSGAAIVVGDNSCTDPSFAALSTKLPDGRPYQAFRNTNYTGANADTGPVDDARTREGSFEVIEMGEITGNTLQMITHVNGVPFDCSKVQTETATIPASDIAQPAGGLAGSAAIVNAAQGTFFAANAYAIDGFRNEAKITLPNDPSPSLADASAGTNQVVTAYVTIGGQGLTLNYPAVQAIDAVSAVLMMDRMSTDWDLSGAAGASTDLVLTFPTKRYYTDPALLNGMPAIQPFPNRFGAPTASRSDLTFGYATYDRDGKLLSQLIGVDPPPPAANPGPIGYATQVATFLSGPNDPPGQSLVLGSHLAAYFPITPVIGGGPTPDFAGVADFDFTQPIGEGHALRATNEGYAMQGLPVIGFEAVNYINANVTPGVLANYSGAYPIRGAALCVSTNGSNANTACPSNFF